MAVAQLRGRRKNHGFVALDEEHIDFRYLADAAEGVIVKIAFLHDAVPDRDAAMECGRQALDDATLAKIGSSGFVLVVESQNQKTGLGARFGTQLLERGHSESTVRKIFGGNLLRLFTDTW